MTRREDAPTPLSATHSTPGAQVDPDATSGPQKSAHGLDRIDAFIRSVVYAAGNTTKADFELAPPTKEDR